MMKITALLMLVFASMAIASDSLAFGNQRLVSNTFFQGTVRLLSLSYNSNTNQLSGLVGFEGFAVKDGSVKEVRILMIVSILS